MTGPEYRRLYLEGPLESGTTYTLEGDEHHYLSRVLRLKKGAILTVFDGRGGEYVATVDHLERSCCRVVVGDHSDVERETPLELRLAQGIGRGEHTDFAIQKAVELGATSIVPLLTRRGVVRLEPERARRRLAHWRGVIIHACQQCGRNRIPELAPVAVLEDWLRDCRGGGLDLMLEPTGDLGWSKLDYHGGMITLLVGPEGGLSDDEIRAAHAAGFKSIALGQRILRTETAAIAGLTAIQIRWGDLDGT